MARTGASAIGSLFWPTPSTVVGLTDNHDGQARFICGRAAAVLALRREAGRGPQSSTFPARRIATGLACKSQVVGLAQAAARGRLRRSSCMQGLIRSPGISNMWQTMTATQLMCDARRHGAPALRAGGSGAGRQSLSAEGGRSDREVAGSLRATAGPPMEQPFVQSQMIFDPGALA